MKQQELPKLQRGLTFAERGPREKLYVIPANHYGSTQSKLARKCSNWGVTFTTDAAAAAVIRQHFPLPLSTVKKLMQRCRKHNYFGTVYVSWRDHPQGFEHRPHEDVSFIFALLRLMEKV